VSFPFFLQSDNSLDQTNKSFVQRSGSLVTIGSNPERAEPTIISYCESVDAIRPARVLAWSLVCRFNFGLFRRKHLEVSTTAVEMALPEVAGTRSGLASLYGAQGRALLWLRNPGGVCPPRFQSVTAGFNSPALVLVGRVADCVVCVI
jgi:hypothetical protein